MCVVLTIYGTYIFSRCMVECGTAGGPAHVLLPVNFIQIILCRIVGTYSCVSGMGCRCVFPGRVEGS